MRTAALVTAYLFFLLSLGMLLFQNIAYQAEAQTDKRAPSIEVSPDGNLWQGRVRICATPSACDDYVDRNLYVTEAACERAMIQKLLHIGLRYKETYPREPKLGLFYGCSIKAGATDA